MGSDLYDVRVERWKRGTLEEMAARAAAHGLDEELARAAIRRAKCTPTARVTLSAVDGYGAPVGDCGSSATALRRPAVAGVKGIGVLERGAVFWLLIPGSRDAWGCAARM